MSDYAFGKGFLEETDKLSDLVDYAIRLDTRGKYYAQNVAVWHDGTIRPARGHKLGCIWFFDGQFWYHRGENI